MSMKTQWHFPVRAADDDICKHECQFQCHACMLAEKAIMQKIKDRVQEDGVIYGPDDVWDDYTTSWGTTTTSATAPVIHVPSFTGPKLLKVGEIVEVENLEIDQTLRLKEGEIVHA